MTDLDWPMIALAGWFAVSLARSAWLARYIWRSTPEPSAETEAEPEPAGIQILHFAADAASRPEVGATCLTVFCPPDTPADVFQAASDRLDRNPTPGRCRL